MHSIFRSGALISSRALRRDLPWVINRHKSKSFSHVWWQSCLPTCLFASSNELNALWSSRLPGIYFSSYWRNLVFPIRDLTCLGTQSWPLYKEVCWSVGIDHIGQLCLKTSRLYLSRHGAHQPHSEHKRPRLGLSPQDDACGHERSLLSLCREHHRDSVLVCRGNVGHELRQKDPGGAIETIWKLMPSASSNAAVIW